MNNDDHSIDISKLEDNCYFLDKDEGSYSENVRYHKAEFVRLYYRKVRLPDGRGNVIYILSDTFENSLKLIGSKNFLIPPMYRRFYYPWISFGAFMGRRYRLNLNKEKGERAITIKALTKLTPYATRTLQKSKENVFFGCADLYNIVLPILQRFPIKKLMTQFYQEFNTLITNMTPPIDKEMDDPAWNNRIIIIDADRFKFKPGGSLAENKTNPLFLIYIAYLRSRDLSTLNVDRDMLICSKNMFIKFNPIRLTPGLWSRFRVGLFKIMKSNLDNYVDQLSPEEQEEITQVAEDHLVHSVVDDSIKPYTKYVSPSTKGILGDAIDSTIRRQIAGNNAISKIVKDEQEKINQEIKPGSSFKQIFNKSNEEKSPIKTNPYEPVSLRRQNLFDAIIKDYKPLVDGISPEEDEEENDFIINDYEDEIKDDVNDILADDEGVREEVLDEIQDRIAPIRNPETSPINSARDQKLREEQKKIVVRNSTIEEILERDASNVPIKTENKSAVLKTSNQNMHNITFANFDKTYIEELYTKDLIACFDMLKDKDSPFHITGINIKDTSNSMDLKETWSVHLIDENDKRHTMKIDIPKFYNNRFMWLGGNKYVILKQNYYYPLVKDTADTVILTTSYNKITISRKATKSLDAVERIFSLVKKTGNDKIFTRGNPSLGNLKYISSSPDIPHSLEYDELSKRIFKYSSNDCEMYFSRDYIKNNLQDKIPKDIKGNEFFIGTEGDVPILINEDTGLDRSGRTITDIIAANLSVDYKAIYDSIKGTSQPMFAQGKLDGQPIPVVATLMVWVGISKMLDKMGIKWTFHPNISKIPKDSNGMNYIKFADGILEYEKKIFSELILNGIYKLKPKDFEFDAFNSDKGYGTYLFSVWRNYDCIARLKNFYEFLIDPITKQVCQDLMLPTDPDGLLIHAVKLLSDDASVSKASDKSYRVRSLEIIPGILHSLIARQYFQYVKNARKTNMTLDTRSLISALQGGSSKPGSTKQGASTKMVEEYSTLNPAVEVAKFHTISTKGYKGTNMEHAYRSEQKRSYDPSSIGKIAMSTSPR